MFLYCSSHNEKDIKFQILLLQPPSSNRAHVCLRFELNFFLVPAFIFRRVGSLIFQNSSSRTRGFCFYVFTQQKVEKRYIFQLFFIIEIEIKAQFFIITVKLKLSILNGFFWKTVLLFTPWQNQTLIFEHVKRKRKTNKDGGWITNFFIRKQKHVFINCEVHK